MFPKDMLVHLYGRIIVNINKLLGWTCAHSQGNDGVGVL